MTEDRSQLWERAFSEKTAEAFAAAFDDNVVLEASITKAPIRGREDTQRILSAVSALYRRVVFAHQTDAERRTYLEWEVESLKGPRHGSYDPQLR
jgi:hypothetical protein